MGLIKKFRIKSFKNTNTILEFKNISLSYGNRLILDNINFKINEGQIFGMLGPNGVGKSTIFNLITGLITPKYGKILINGHDATNFPIYLRTKKFKVSVVKVNIINQKTKIKLKQGRKSYKTGYKKAIVTLKKGQSIDLTTGI